MGSGSRHEEDSVSASGRVDRSGARSREKLRAIKERVQSGYYSRPEVVKRIAETLTGREEIRSALEQPDQTDPGPESVQGDERNDKSKGDFPDLDDSSGKEAI